MPVRVPRGLLLTEATNLQARTQAPQNPLSRDSNRQQLQHVLSQNTLGQRKAPPECHTAWFGTERKNREQEGRLRGRAVPALLLFVRCHRLEHFPGLEVGGRQKMIEGHRRAGGPTGGAEVDKGPSILRQLSFFIDQCFVDAGGYSQQAANYPSTVKRRRVSLFVHFHLE